MSVVVSPGNRVALRARNRGNVGNTLGPFMAGLSPDWHSTWAWENYQSTIVALSQRFGLREACEIGGGRDPLFLPQAADRLGFNLTVNDIDAGELNLCPPGLRTARFDIAGDMSEPDARPGSFDLMFSRMVFEHVADVEAAWTNMHRLLKPGGVGLAFFPTLWAPVFAVNHLIPESWSQRIVNALYPRRRAGQNDPKFPALYSHCFGSATHQKTMLGRAGFSDVHVQPFWGHGYFERMPVIREMDHAFNWATAKLDIRLVTTYAFVLARKSG
jgi:SAM-dependent methyltransferase